jgi:hypothetical protein
MWQDDIEGCRKFGAEFATRFHAFRVIEARCLEMTGNPRIAPEAWVLLEDLELAYSARAYTACFCLACAMIEIHLRRLTKVKASKLKFMLQEVGLEAELGWLAEMRNNIMHGNPSPFISPHRMPEDEERLEALCTKAFVAIHTIAARTTTTQA